MEKDFFLQQILRRLDDIPVENLKILIENCASDLAVIRSVADTIHTGLCVLDHDGFFVYANMAAARLLSLRHHHMQHIRSGSVVNFYDVITNEDIRSFVEKAQKKNCGNLVSDDIILNIRVGKTRIAVVESFPFYETGKFVGVILKIDDVTETRGREKLYQQMQNLVSLTNLSANLAHEIKNPLGSISLYMQLLQKTAKKCRKNGILPDEEHLENYISVVNEEIERLNTLVTNFLDAVKPVNAPLSLHDPNEILTKMCHFFEPEFYSGNITFEKKLCLERYEIFLNEDLFKQVIFNLIQNSIFAMKDRKNAVLSMKTYVADERFVVDLEDNGCGMDETTCTRIFEPYFTTKTSGTGLGMTTVYKIMKVFNGKINIKSQLEKGTKILLTFPIPKKEIRLLT